MEKSKKILTFLLLFGCIIVFGKNEALAKARYSYASVNADVKTAYTEEIEAPDGWFGYRAVCWQRKVKVTAKYDDQSNYSTSIGTFSAGDDETSIMGPRENASSVKVKITRENDGWLNKAVGTIYVWTE